MFKIKKQNNNPFGYNEIVWTTIYSQHDSLLSVIPVNGAASKYRITNTLHTMLILQFLFLSLNKRCSLVHMHSKSSLFLKRLYM